MNLLTHARSPHDCLFDSILEDPLSPLLSRKLEFVDVDVEEEADEGAAG